MIKITITGNGYSTRQKVAALDKRLPRDHRDVDEMMFYLEQEQGNLCKSMMDDVG